MLRKITLYLITTVIFFSCSSPSKPYVITEAVLIDQALTVRGYLTEPVTDTNKLKEILLEMYNTGRDANDYAQKVSKYGSMLFAHPLAANNRYDESAVASFWKHSVGYAGFAFNLKKIANQTSTQCDEVQQFFIGKNYDYCQYLIETKNAFAEARKLAEDSIHITKFADAYKAAKSEVEKQMVIEELKDNIADDGIKAHNQKYGITDSLYYHFVGLGDQCACIDFQGKDQALPTKK